MLYCAACEARIPYPFHRCASCGGQRMLEQAPAPHEPSLDTSVWPPAPRRDEGNPVVAPLIHLPITRTTDTPNEALSGFAIGVSTQVALGLLIGMTPFGLFLSQIQPQLCSGHLAFWLYLFLIPASVIALVARWMHWVGHRKFSVGLLLSLSLSASGVGLAILWLP